MIPPPFLMKLKLSSFCLLLCLSLHGGLLQSEKERNRLALDALKITTEEAPVLDGTLDDAIWAKAPVGDDFTQVELLEGAQPTERTEIRFLYDHENLYVGIQCFDSEPEKIVAHQMERDVALGSDDFIHFVLDPYNSNRNGYFFAINPRGARTDGQLKKAWRSASREWDGIWDGKAVIHDQGWSAELVIPSRTLSMEADVTTWGMNFERLIARKNERIRWNNPFRRDNVYALGQLGELKDIEGLEQGLGVDFKPYITFTRQTGFEEPFDDYDLNSGFDIFYKVTPSITASLSYNMDFAETESDLRRVNLSRYPLLFPEKRDFFLQDNANFTFGMLNSIQPFFSRRVGLDGDGNPIEIETAFKVSGRSGKVQFGLLNAQTKASPTLGEKNLSVARATVDVGEESSIGFIATHGDPDSSVNKTVFGIDANLHNSNFSDRQVEFKTSIYAAGIFDSGSNTGTPAIYGNHTNIQNDIFLLQLGGYHVDKDYDPPLGYQRQWDLRQYYFFYRYRLRPVNTWMDYVDLEWDFDVATTLDNDLDNLDLEPGIEIEGKDNSELEMIWVYDREDLREPFDIGGQATISAKDYSFSKFLIFYETSNQKPFAIETEFAIGEFWDGDIQQYEAGLVWRVHPTISLAASLNQSDIQLPQADFTTQVATARLDLKFTANLSWRSLTQYDNLTDTVGVNSRLRWIFKPGNEVFLVMNQGVDIQENWKPTTHQSQLKFAWTFRY